LKDAVIGFLNGVLIEYPPPNGLARDNRLEQIQHTKRQGCFVIVHLLQMALHLSEDFSLKRVPLLKQTTPAAYRKFEVIVTI
jgi:hypothetical protein